MARGFFALSLGLALFASAAAAQTPTCAPGKLTRLTIRNVTPGLAAADPRAQPQTIWRRAATFLRKENAPDPARGGAATLLIIAEPDAWTIDVAGGAARHTVDPGPVLEVHAPILPPTPDLPPQLQALEFGCEAAFVAAYAPAASQTARWGAVDATAHVVAFGPHRVAFLMDAATSHPLLISYSKGGQPTLVIRYDAYIADLDDQPDLFRPDGSLRIEEGAPSTPPR